MPAKRRLYYFNALFDLPRQELIKPALHRAAMEMSTLFIALGNAEDLVLLRVKVSDNYREYLQESGLALPSFVNEHFRSCESILPEPWAWDDTVVNLFEKMNLSVPHPPTDIVRVVNDRAFCTQFSQKEGTGVPGSQMMYSFEDFNILLATGELEYPLVLKPSQGSSGFGFVLLNSPPDASMLDRIKQLFEMSSYTVEPWYKRISDISSSVVIGIDGSVDLVRHYRCFVNSRGTFYGVHLSPESPGSSWEGLLTQKALSCSRFLFEKGYFGPVGFDSFIYESSSGDERIAPVIEINARHVISDIARALQSKLVPEKHVFFRFLSSKRCRLPETYSELRTILGSLSFSQQSKTGVLLITPLRACSDIYRQPYRNAFLLSADSESALFDMDRELIMKLSR